MRRIAILIMGLVVLLTLPACGGLPGYSPPAATAQPTATRASSFKYFQPPEWARGAVIYQVYIRAFTPEGTLAAAALRLTELRDLGVEIIYLMPIHPTGVEKRTGSLGSPYSIRDFRAIDPALGSDGDLTGFVKTAHDLGLHVIMDFVANHTAWDNDLINQHPDWYTHDANGKIIPPHPQWLDVADLNYDNADLRQYMIGTSLYWVDTFGLDGYRCDTSFMVPGDFWQAWRKALKADRADLLLLSESDGQEMYQAGFEVAYDWTTPDRFHLALKAPLVASDLLTFIESEQGSADNQIWRVRYLENHDQERIATFTNGYAQDQLAAAFLLTLPGLPMIYAGQEIGDSLRPSLFDKNTVGWAFGNEKLRAEYADQIKLRKGSPALRSGGFDALDAAQDGVFVYLRDAAEQKVVVALNVSADPVTVTLPWFSSGKDLQSGEKVDVGKGVEVGGYGYRIIEVK